ncbi:complex I subunit 5 family protein [Paeniroseomonas aquatica]|uniref:Complex I subunit 5 family protein n=1 Tax=Paeniroseomonas aquatica TaxID=373043 RepID=A0ABT8AHX3_9PROT|nr:complex I subunit 5 family protein [Paeniroseomonas aquatica]MDN3568979.1 complex I subunit 5 family protein [Paeniroseomonas aquatica]
MTGSQYLLLASFGAPLGLLIACLWEAPRRRLPGLLWLAPLPALAAALLAADGPPLVLDPARLRFTLALDAPSALLLGAVALLWSAAGAYAHGYLGGKPGARRFALWWLVTLSGSLGVFVAADLVSFYLAFALVSLPAFGLIVQDGTPRARRAGEVTLLLAVLGEVALLLGFALLGDAVPGPSLAIADALAALPDSPARSMVVGLLVAGFGLKAGLVPLHVWLPLAHPAAPMPASAVLSGAIVKAGIIGLLRFLPPDAADWGGVLAGLGLATAFWGVGCGITQDNPKTVLAYSTVSQMGVTVAALGMGLALAVPGTAMAVAFYAAHHVLAKGALFLAVGVGAVLGGARRRTLVLLPALVLALGFGGMPGTGGALAKAAVKPQLGDGLPGLLAALSAMGSTLLMLHFTRRLAAVRPAAARSVPILAPVLLAAWLGMAAAALLLPWALYRPLGLGNPWDVLGKDLAMALWPVLAGALLAIALARWGGRLPRVPEGDLLVLTGRAGGLGEAIGAAVARLEAALRAWPVAGMALLALILALFGTMLAAAR